MNSLSDGEDTKYHYGRTCADLGYVELQCGEMGVNGYFYTGLIQGMGNNANAGSSNGGGNTGGTGTGGTQFTGGICTSQYISTLLLVYVAAHAFLNRS